MTLVIVSGPYEGERLRRAAVAAGFAARVAESLDVLESESVLGRPSAVLVTVNLAAPAQLSALERLRERLGGDVPIVVLGDPETRGAMERMTAAFFPRPMGADELMQHVRAVARPVAEPSDMPGLPVRGAPPLELSPPPLLAPLRVGPAGHDAERLMAPAVDTVVKETPVVSAPLSVADPGPPSLPSLPAPRALDRLAASIDETLDAELLAAARTAAVDDAIPVAPEMIIATAVSAAPAFPPPPAFPDEATRGDLQAATHAPSSDDHTVPLAVGPNTATVVRRTGLPLEGELADADLPTLLGRAHVEAVTGRLRVRQGAVEKAIFFEAGRPVLATSNATDDRMIEIFLRQGRISPLQHAQAVKAATETGRRMGALLVDLGIMKTAELLPAVREHYEEIIVSMFGWEVGRWVFDMGVVADPRRIRLLRHPAALVAAGVRRAYPLARMQRRLGSTRNVFVLDARGSAAEVLAEVATDPRERRVTLLFDGVRTFEEVVRVSGLTDEAVYALALTLWAFGALVPATGGADGPPAFGGRGRDLVIERERILARLALVNEGDYFQMLGLERRADAAEVRRVHERIERELSPVSVGPELGHALAEELETIRQALLEAVRVLSDDGLRVGYRRALEARASDDGGREDLPGRPPPAVP